MAITPEQARAELARRELARRGVGLQNQMPLNAKTNLKDLLASHVRNIAKSTLAKGGEDIGTVVGQPELGQKIGYGALPFLQQLPAGIIEGLKRSKAGLTGQQFTPSEVPEEYGASFGRGAGELLGQGAAVAPFAALGGLVGGPVGAYAGAGIGAGATTPGGLPERALASGETLALPLVGKVAGTVAKKALSIPMKSLFQKVNPEGALAIAHARHDALKDTASELFNWSREQMKERGITSIVPDKSIVGKVKDFLPDTTEHKKLFSLAQEGNPDALHDLQSLLWKKGTKAKGSSDPAVENKGEEMLSLRDALNRDIHSKLAQGGHTDLVHAYKQGQKLFKELKDTYYNYNKIAKVFDPELRKIPSDIVKHFSENSAPMKEFFKLHPELEREVGKGISKIKAQKDLAKLSSLAGGAGGTAYLGEKIYKLFND